MERLKLISARVLPWVAIGMGVYQLLYTQIMIQDLEGHLITHLGLAMAVVCFSLMAKADTRSGFLAPFILMIISIGVTAYYMISLEAIMEFRSAIPIVSDLLVGVLMVLVLLVVNWVIFGKAFPLITILALTYLFLGRYFPPPFRVADVGLIKMVQWVTVEFEGGQGLYGSILQLSATYLFLFIFFGGLLSAFGGTKFIIGLGRLIGSKLSSGPAMVALVGSSLLGTITGSTVANITITGAFTIPMMKEGGYTPEQSGAIEAVSSNGGQITPPVMGATAFVLAGFAGVPYIKVAIAAIMPAIIYYFSVFCYVQLTAKRLNLKARIEPVNIRHLLLSAPTFILPIGVLMVMLNAGYSLPFVGFWSIMTIVAVGFLLHLLSFVFPDIKETTRLDAAKLKEEIYKSAVTASQIAVVCALIGVVATCIKVSGLGIKMPMMIKDISGGITLIALFIAMVSSILLGMGVPTTAAYILVAIGAVPALLEMGIPLLPAHLFCFTFASFSHITPPVAVGALVAARMAKANYWRTNWEAIKAAFVAFLLPFFIVYIPLVTMASDAIWWVNLIQLVGIVIIILTAQFSLTGYCFDWLGSLARLAFLVPSLLGLVYLFTRLSVFFYLSALLMVGLLIWQYRLRDRRTTYQTAQPR